MPVPTTIADLSITAESNYPQGGEAPNVIDDYIRAHASIIKQVSNSASSASFTSFAPTGSVAATDVQSAIAEVASDSCQKSANLSDVSNAGTARNNIGAAASGAVASSGITMDTSKLLGRSTAGSGAIEELSLGTGLAMSGGALNCTVTATVSSVGGHTGVVTDMQLASSVSSALAVTAGTIYSNYATSTTAGSWQTVEVANVICYVSGVVRVRTGGNSNGSTEWGGFAVYKNGVAINGGSGTNNVYVSRTDDVTVTQGDTIQVFASMGTPGTMNVTEFSLGTANIPKIVPFSSIPLGYR